MNILKNKKIIIFTRYNHYSASVRYRFLQYKDILEKNGFSVELSPLFNTEFFINKIVRNKLNIISVIIGYFKRIIKLIFLKKDTLVFIHLELFPYLPSFGEKILSIKKIKTIVDLDDAIFLQYKYKNALINFFFKNKFKSIFNISYAIFAGNEYNKIHAIEQGSKNVFVFPTVVSVSKYKDAYNFKKNDKFTIVWIGSPSTAIYLQGIYKTLLKLNNEHDIKIRIIGAGEINLPGIQYESYRWSQKNELQLISECHTGIMPLPDTNWAQGKCGFKLIQYMACGLPSVASPVGVNKDIIDHNINGFLASKDDEWIKYILKLKNNNELFNQFSNLAYKKILNNYSFESWKEKYLSTIMSFYDKN